MSVEIEPSYWAILTSSVLFDPELSSEDKILFAHISVLTKKEGFCFANNSYFGSEKVMNCAKETISRRISKLEKRGHIKTQIIYAEDGKTIEQRRIFVMTLGAYIGTPIDASVKDNINKAININKQSKKTRKKPKPTKVETTEDEMIVHYPRFTTTRRFVSSSAP